MNQQKYLFKERHSWLELSSIHATSRIITALETICSHFRLDIVVEEMAIV
jgi:hypothetical protein